MYSRNEKVDMLLIYGECKKNSRQAATLYGERFPERNHPPNNYFLRVEEQFRREQDQPENNFIINEESEINVLAIVEADPTISLRHIEDQIGVNRESARRILKKHKFKSYRYQIHQYLYENDFQRRLDYCNWFLHRHNLDNNFHQQILFSDESRFTNLGLFNRNNTRYWAQENPRNMRESAYQERFSFNVWLGVIGRRIIGPIIFDGPLNGERYLEFLQNQMEDFLEELPLNVDPIIFQQDGAPPHNSRLVVNYLDERFGENWMGTNGPVRWPARSPDLTPLDFFIWGHLKEEVYRTPPTNREDMEIRVRGAINGITELQLDNMLRATVKKTRLCRDNNGQHFEHLE